MRWDPNKSLLAGVPMPTLQTYLANARQAYADLMSGAKIVNVSYEGKSVTYTPADASRLEAWIMLLQAQISGCRTRRALRPYFS